jgi:hypothetical protein
MVPKLNEFELFCAAKNDPVAAIMFFVMFTGLTYKFPWSDSFAVL